MVSISVRPVIDGSQAATDPRESPSSRPDAISARSSWRRTHSSVTRSKLCSAFAVQETLETLQASKLMISVPTAEDIPSDHADRHV